MTRAARWSAALFVLALISFVRAGGQNDPQADWQRHLLSEITRLRADLVEYLAEEKQARVAALTHELKQVRRQQKHLQRQESQHAQTIADLEQQLTSPELEPEARPQIEALKNQMAGEGAGKLRAEQGALEQREAEIARQIEREAQRAQRFLEEMRQLQPALNQP